MKISQREARRLRARANALEDIIRRQRAVYLQDWFKAVNIATVTLNSVDVTAIRTARRLSHAVVVVSDETNDIRFMALPAPKADIL